MRHGALTTVARFGAERGPAVDAIPQDWPGREHSRIVAAAGGRWHVQRCGSGPAILLLHGTAASTHTWRHLVPMLAGHFEILALDLPGHGYSERLVDHSMALPAIAAGVADLLSVSAFEPECVIGHSAGAAIALRLALDGAIRPDGVIGLNAALLPFGGAMRRVFSPMAQLFATTRLMPRMIARRANDLGAVRRILNGTGSAIDAGGVELYQRLLKNEQHVAAVLAMMANWDLEPLLEDLPRLEAQLCLVAGGRDRAVRPREADRIAASLPGTTVTRLENCGHLAHEEQPRCVADLIVGFMSELAVDTSARRAVPHGGQARA